MLQWWPKYPTYPNDHDSHNNPTNGDKSQVVTKEELTDRSTNSTVVTYRRLSQNTLDNLNTNNLHTTSTIAVEQNADSTFGLGLGDNPPLEGSNEAATLGIGTKPNLALFCSP